MEKYPFFLLLMTATNKMCIDAKEIKNFQDNIDKLSKCQSRVFNENEL